MKEHTCTFLCLGQWAKLYMVIVSSRVDVSLVAEKLNSSSGEQLQETDNYKTINLSCAHACTNLYTNTHSQLHIPHAPDHISHSNSSYSYTSM